MAPLLSVRFDAEPVLMRAPRGQFSLCAPLAVTVDVCDYVIPEGFTTDGASIPPLFWAMVGHPYSPSSLRAAILHDWMCRERDHRWSSTAVHRIFFAALLADGVAFPRAWVMWLATHWFGPSFKGAA